MRKVSLIPAVLVIALVAMFAFVGGFGFSRLSNLQAVSAAEAAFAASPSVPRVVYLTSEGSQLPHFVAVLEEKGGVVLQSQAQVYMLDGEVPLDALIFDSNTKDDLSRDWVMDHYLRGVIMVAVNTPIVELADFVGDPGAADGPWAEADPPSEDAYYSMIYLSISGSNQDEIDRFLTAVPNSSEPDGSDPILPDISGELTVSRGKTQTSLADEASARLLWTNVTNYVAQVKSNR
jgi:hypothetical protein